MAYISTEIKSYSYMIFSGQEAPAKISLIDNNNFNFATVFIRPDSETIPFPFIDATGMYRMFFHRKYFSDVLDMLRNEKPLYFNYWEAGGQNSHIGTTREPVGENE